MDLKCRSVIYSFCVLRMYSDVFIGSILMCDSMIKLWPKFKGTNPALKKSSNIPEIYAKMLGRFH